MRARHALTAAGLSVDVPLTRAASVTNEVWLTPDHVIRVNRNHDNRLRREAQLGAALPPEVRYPPIVAYGGEIGADWLIVARLPGTSLSHVWPDLDRTQRRRATRQIAELLTELHRVEAPADLLAMPDPPLLSGPTGSPLGPGIRDALDRAGALPHVDAGLIEDAKDRLDDWLPHVEPWSARTLVHADLSFENVLFDGDRVTGLLDYEWARAAPADLELDMLLRMSAMPRMFVADQVLERTRPDAYLDVPHWLADDYPALVDVPHVLERTCCYALAFDVAALLGWPPEAPAAELGASHPVNRLASVVRGRSYLHELAGIVATDSYV